ncbi:MAG: undecaprenyl/decaprenyl-phosphate alpha-N-acetylglucosaminyl 1-phosphate transferase [Sphaerobacteraceae bacterium]|nr:MAG: undecaprenyl/decaprenyl-phosphate alpha-N-acetylglucosaminyl 1-phosphate transferase [Sphaerobacteraceae bacterium]
MGNALIALIVAAGTIALVRIIVPALLRLAHDRDLLLYPTDPRQVHTSPIPKFGGIAMFMAFCGGIAITFMLPVERFPEEIERIVLLVTGAAIVAGVMLYDDLIGIAPLPKLAWQILAAGVMIVPRFRGEEHGLVIEQFTNPFGGMIELPLLLAIPITLLWIVGMMNTLNWVDGLDGLACTITLVATSVLFLHTFFRPPGDPQFTISLLAVALGAAVIGFISYNWHPSRILMGDTGAMFLGFSLAVISIIGGAKIATALLALWVPILDVAWVIIYRILHGRSPLKADRGHLHHRLLDMGWTQPQIVLLFGGLSGTLGIASLLIPTPQMKLFLLILAGAAGVGILALLARRAGPLFERQSTDA